jgi:Arc/MetJ-type ribon-helix-helix transcriptional regulator
MTTINVPLPDKLEEFVAARAALDGFCSASDYVLELIRRAQQSSERSKLEARLLTGVQSLDRGEGRPMTPADWNRLRADIKNRQNWSNEFLLPG